MTQRLLFPTARGKPEHVQMVVKHIWPALRKQLIELGPLSHSIRSCFPCELGLPFTPVCAILNRYVTSTVKGLAILPRMLYRHDCRKHLFLQLISRVDTAVEDSS